MMFPLMIIQGSKNQELERPLCTFTGILFETSEILVRWPGHQKGKRLRDFTPIGLKVLSVLRKEGSSRRCNIWQRSFFSLLKSQNVLSVY